MPLRVLLHTSSGTRISRQRSFSTGGGPTMPRELSERGIPPRLGPLSPRRQLAMRGQRRSTHGKNSTVHRLWADLMQRDVQQLSSICDELVKDLIRGRASSMVSKRPRKSSG